MLQCDKELVLADVTDQVTWAVQHLQHTIRGGMQPAAVLGNTGADHRTCKRFLTNGDGSLFNLRACNGFQIATLHVYLLFVRLLGQPAHGRTTWYRDDIIIISFNILKHESFHWEVLK